MKQTQAEVIAIKAAGWLVAHEELLPIFLGSTGASEQDFRQSLDNMYFLGSVLDFILMDDAWIRQFCEAESLELNLPYQARMALPGGTEVHWT